MAKILVLGETGFGKTTSLIHDEELGIEGLSAKDSYIITVTNKRLPGGKQSVDAFPTLPKELTTTAISKDHLAPYRRIMTNNPVVVAHMITLLGAVPPILNIVVDDANYLMQDYYMSKALATGWDAPKRIGYDMGLIFNAMYNLPEEKNFIMMAHGEEYDKADGRKGYRITLPAGEGLGLAVGAWPGGRQPASAICRLEADGRVSVITGVVDMSGTMTGFATLAAEGLGIPSEQVSVTSADTASAPRSPVSGGSVITYSTGRAVQKATEALKEKILAYASLLLEIDVRDLEMVDGAVQPKGTPEKRVTLAKIGEELDGFSSDFEPLEGHGGSVPPVLAPLTSAHLVHVRVDPQTGRVGVVRYVLAQDVGRALNPAIIEGQLHGGATQGLGWALSESMEYDEGGQLLTGTFLDYAIPQAPDVPVFETIIVEVPAPTGRTARRASAKAPCAARLRPSPMRSPTRPESDTERCR